MPESVVESKPLEQFRLLLEQTAPPAWRAGVEAGDRAALERFAHGPYARPLAETVARHGWLTPDWPERYGGRDLGPEDALLVKRELYRWHVGSVRSAIGTTWVGPTLLEYGSDRLRERLLPPIAADQAQWCQLFSEADAGSDLAAVRTAARPADDGWIIEGAKLWTSRADTASWGLAVVRTDLGVPKHSGLTCFCIDMHAPGVTVSPIRQMTGDAEFFETRLDSVWVPDELRVGDLGQGWEIVRAVLAFERKAGSGLGNAPPGSVIGRSVRDLIDRAGEGLEPARVDRLVQLYVDGAVIELNNRRMAAVRRAGGTAVSASPFNKVLQSEHSQRLQQMAVDLDGFASRYVAPEDDSWTRVNVHALLRVQAKSIAGGTNNVLRNQIAERVLGLPREPDPSRGKPWGEFLAEARGMK